MNFRNIINNLFTATAWVSAMLLIAILGIVLIPMFVKGSTAVFFKGTVEFREMQLELYGRGNPEEIKQEVAETEAVRDELRAIISDFRNGLDRDNIRNNVRSIYREYGDELKLKGTARDIYTENRKIAKDLRDLICDAMESNDKDLVNTKLNTVLESENNPIFKDSVISEYFPIVRDFQHTIKDIDLNKQAEINESLVIIEEGLAKLFGPKPDEPSPAMAKDKYGMTRLDMVNRQLDQILNEYRWEANPDNPDGLQIQVAVPRKEIFAGTDLEQLFVRLEKDIDKMFHPRFTFYWQFFIDDSHSSHYLGGVGPEILGTLVLTVLSMLFVIPFGIITAAWLVECAKDNWVTTVIRMSINSLAGVPSVVFGVFGMAFFVLWLFPALGMEPVRCILAGSMTLALLTLPVMIRASEEAIRSVPNTYKEASLGLGAGRTRTFICITLPAALPGILTGVILSLSRVAGETAPIIFTATVALGPLPKSIFDTTRTLSFGSYDMAVGDRIAMMVPHNQFGMVSTLILLILLLNTVAIIFRARIFKKLKGH